MQELSRLKKQKGVATLLIAVMLIIATTLVTFLTAKTVLQETKITANNYRTVQATSAASAAMDEATAYFMAGGLDQIGAFDADGNPIGDGSVDYAVGTPMAINLIIGAQTTRAQFYFDNDDDNLCDCQSDLSEDGDCMETVSSALMVAQGWSDDDSATRTVSQCVGLIFLTAVIVLSSPLLVKLGLVYLVMQRLSIDIVILVFGQEEMIQYMGQVMVLICALQGQKLVTTLQNS
jgi:hypothetical protein